VLDIQLDIHGKLAGTAMRAQVVGPRYSRLAYGCENRFGAQLQVMCPMATSTSHVAPIRRGFGELQQPGERSHSRLVHGRAKRRLQGFQIDASTSMAVGKDTAESMVTSRAISVWIISAVFFLWRECLLDRAQRTDLLTDLDDLSAEFLKTMKGRHFLLRFTQTRSIKGLGYGLTLNLTGQPKIGGVAGIVRLGAVASWFAAFAGGCGNGPRRKSPRAASWRKRSVRRASH